MIRHGILEHERHSEWSRGGEDCVLKQKRWDEKEGKKKPTQKLKIKMKGRRVYGGIRDGEKEKKALLMKLSVKGEMSPRRRASLTQRDLIK